MDDAMKMSLLRAELLKLFQAATKQDASADPVFMRLFDAVKTNNRFFEVLAGEQKVVAEQQRAALSAKLIEVDSKISDYGSVASLK